MQSCIRTSRKEHDCANLYSATICRESDLLQYFSEETATIIYKSLRLYQVIIREQLKVFILFLLNFEKSRS